LLAAILVTAPLPAAADSVIASYHAYIGVDDLYNSKGELLSAPWQVLRQDRANYHRYGIAQQGDDWDPVFHDVKAREALERLLQRGSLSPAARADIMRSDTQVHITIWGQGRTATYVDVVTWAECGC
jgi:hypothetical protein